MNEWIERTNILAIQSTETTSYIRRYFMYDLERLCERIIFMDFSRIAHEVPMMPSICHMLNAFAYTFDRIVFSMFAVAVAQNINSKGNQRANRRVTSFSASKRTGNRSSILNFFVFCALKWPNAPNWSSATGPVCVCVCRSVRWIILFTSFFVSARTRHSRQSNKVVNPARSIDEMNGSGSEHTNRTFDCEKFANV